MDLFVLVGQRKQRYEGEYLPEALAVIDDIGDSDNPEYMREQLQKQTESGDFDALTVLRLSVSEKAVKAALYPEPTVLQATVVPN